MKVIKIQKNLFRLLWLGAFLLTSCAQQQTFKSKKNSTLRIPPSSQTKWTFYVKAYNYLEGSQLQKLGSATFMWQRKKTFNKLKKGDFTYIYSSLNAEQDARNLQEALCQSGSIESLDKVAINLLQAINQALPNWQQLEFYNSHKVYLLDHGREGRTRLQQFLRDQANLEILYQTFRKTFEDQMKQQNQLQMEYLKNTHQLLPLQAFESLHQAEEMLDFLKQQPIEKLHTSNGLKISEQHLAKFQESLGQLHHSLRTEENAVAYIYIYQLLTSYSHQYQYLLKHPNVRNLNRTIEDYNLAVDAYNTLVE